jgi:hypothetical protein
LTLPCESHPSGIRFSLHGVVVHTGEVRAGHYFSLLKHSGRWIRVNDTIVDDIKQAHFEAEGFGGDPERPYASLLFYATESALAPASLADFLDITGEIEQDNCRFCLEFVAISAQVIELFCSSGDIKRIVEFFFNSFCHGRAIRFIESFVSSFEQLDIGQLIDNLGKEFEQKIAPVYTYYSVLNILDAVTRILQSAISRSPHNHSFSVVNGIVREFIQLLPTFSRKKAR